MRRPKPELVSCGADSLASSGYGESSYLIHSGAMPDVSTSWYEPGMFDARYLRPHMHTWCDEKPSR